MHLQVNVQLQRNAAIGMVGDIILWSNKIGSITVAFSDNNWYHVSIAALYSQIAQPGWDGVTPNGYVRQCMTGIHTKLDPHHRAPSHPLVTTPQLYLEYANSMSLLDSVTFSQMAQVSI